MALYTAQGFALAGRNGQASTVDGKLDLQLSYPKAMGGSGEGTNPEQLFAVGYAACFSNALLFVAKAEGVALAKAPVHAEVGLIQQDVGFALTAALAIELELPQQQAEALVAKAHQVCPYSNALHGNVDVQLTVKGLVQTQEVVA